MYSQSLKKLVIHNGNISINSLNDINYLTNLEELELDNASFQVYVDFSPLKKLTSLVIRCSGNSLLNIPPEFFNLIELKRFYLSNCAATISTSLDNSLT